LKQAVTAERRTLIKNTISENILSLAREAGKNDLPLVIMLEDMQWADELSLAALNHFVSAVNLAAGEEDLMLFLLLNYRPSYRPGRVLRKECRLVEIELKGFSESESKQFISKLTGSKKITTNAVEQISRRSEGNPFNLEEICRSLDDGSKHIKIPATVKGLLVDKVSQLDKDERAVLIIASVLGRKFSLKLLNAILKKAGKPLARADALSRLEEKQYLVNLTSDIYEFRHDLLQEIVYRELRKDLRKNVHALAAAAIEEIYSANLSAHYYELARHFEDAGDEANTIKYLEKAGDKARDNYENDRAERYYNKLLKLDNNIVNKVSIQLKLCDVYMNRSEWDKQFQLCKDILDKNITLERIIRAECYKRIGNVFRLKGGYKEALKNYKKAYRIYDEKQHLQGKLDIMEREAKVMLVMGKYKEAISSFEMIYKISQTKGFDNSHKNSLMGLGIASSKIGSYEDTIKYNDILFKFARENTNKQDMLVSRINKAEALFYLGEYEKAYDLYKGVLVEYKQIISIYDRANCIGNIGSIYYRTSKLRLALNLFSKQYDLFLQIGDRAGMSRAMGSMGACYISLGSYDRALYYLKRHLGLSRDMGRLQSISVCLSNIGTVYSIMGEYKKARKCFDEQTRIDRKIDSIDGIIRYYINIGILDKTEKKHKKAISNFRKVLKLLQRYPNNENYLHALHNLAESYYEIGAYAKAKLIIQQALAMSAIKDKKNIVASLRCIQMKVNLNDITSKKPVRANLLVDVTKLYNTIETFIKNSTEKEEKAIYCFEQTQIYVLLCSLKANIKVKKPRTALGQKLYKQLFNSFPKHIYKEKILQMKTFRKQIKGVINE